ncbi:MAG: proton-conducting transporter membrane subunit, partial [Anaerolineae bacterium]|nr:proton-conducting transporter membrane subunit [Anaerolineae bacterium]
NPAAIQAALFLLVAHAGLKGLAFLCKGIYHFHFHTTTIDQLHGLAWQLPMPAICFAISLIGLAGLPPLAGFVGKWLLLTEVLVVADMWAYISIALLLGNGLLALGYYLPLIIGLFSPVKTAKTSSTTLSGWMGIPVLILTLLIVTMGFLPNPWLQWIAKSSHYILNIGR